MACKHIERANIFDILMILRLFFTYSIWLFAFGDIPVEAWGCACKYRVQTNAAKPFLSSTHIHTSLPLCLIFFNC